MLKIFEDFDEKDEILNDTKSKKLLPKPNRYNSKKNQKHTASIVNTKRL